MTVASLWVRHHVPSPAVRRWEAARAAHSTASARRRIGIVWVCLFLNVLPYSYKSLLIPLPHSVGTIITQGSLTVALLVAISTNRKVLVRPNLFLLLLTLLCVTSAMMSLQGYFGLSSVLRVARLVEFVAVLWILTPWWGRDDLLMLRMLRRALGVVLATIALGAMIFPHQAFESATGGRLGGTIWPDPTTQVAEFAAILAGTTMVLWLVHLVNGRFAAFTVATSMAILVLTHTRTALVALLVGLLVATLSLFASRRRVRKAIAVTAVIGTLMALSFAPFLGSWFLRGQSSTELGSLTGRTYAWSLVTAQPRGEVNTLLGFGLSNDGIDGLSIDSSWYSSYVDQGVVGDVIDAAMLLLIFVVAMYRPRGPRRAIALFLVVYCVVSSFTETGLGQANTLVLYLAVAMSLLMPPLPLATSEPPGHQRYVLEREPVGAPRQEGV